MSSLNITIVLFVLILLLAFYFLAFKKDNCDKKTSNLLNSKQKVLNKEEVDSEINSYNNFFDNDTN